MLCLRERIGSRRRVRRNPSPCGEIIQLPVNLSPAAPSGSRPTARTPDSPPRSGAGDEGGARLVELRLEKRPFLIEYGLQIL
jgi:hypothetical protein